MGRLASPRRSFNTQPPEGGCAFTQSILPDDAVSTHSRPKAAATGGIFTLLRVRFQHTAARRRLHLSKIYGSLHVDVSTHSRPKAAACDGVFLIR